MITRIIEYRNVYGTSPSVRQATRRRGVVKPVRAISIEVMPGELVAIVDVTNGAAWRLSLSPGSVAPV